MALTRRSGFPVVHVSRRTLAPRRTVGAVREDVVAAVLPRVAVVVGVFPRIVEVGIVDIRPVPVAHIARALDQLTQILWWTTGIEIELVDGHRKSLHLGFGRARLGVLASTHDVGYDQPGDHAQDHEHHQQPDQATISLILRMAISTDITMTPIRAARPRVSPGTSMAISRSMVTRTSRS